MNKRTRVPLASKEVRQRELDWIGLDTNKYSSQRGNELIQVQLTEEKPWEELKQCNKEWPNIEETCGRRN